MLQPAANIYIEISGRCNAKCPYCARQHFNERYSGEMMPPALFEKIIRHLKSNKLIDSNKNTPIFLYNWGEPFIHPEINSIIKILEKENLTSVISSNFIIKPEIEIDNLKNIREIIFSLSGFTQESYGKIHGASLKKVLHNFDEFYKKLQKHSKETIIFINWHRYQFNENEILDAYKYFDKPGIIFRPEIAYFNDLHETVNFIENNINEKRLRNASSELFLEHISNRYSHYNKKHIKSCFMWKCIVIDETGQLLLCCGITNKGNNFTLGNILELTIDEIKHKKTSHEFCTKCLTLGLPAAKMGYMSIPKSKNRYYLKLLVKMKLLFVLSSAIDNIKNNRISSKILNDKKTKNVLTKLYKKILN